MNAIIKPLDGKHYGTIVEVEGKWEINVWIAKGKPSKRQLEEWGISEQEWDTNVWNEGKKPEENEYFTLETPQQMICDSHWESEVSYKTASAIVEALKGIA